MLLNNLEPSEKCPYEPGCHLVGTDRTTHKTEITWFHRNGLQKITVKLIKQITVIQCQI